MPITITWSLKGHELNSGPSITTTMLGKRASMLVISSVDFTHIGEYTCRATNQAGSVTYSTELKVNGNQMSKGRHWKYSPMIQCLIHDLLVEPPSIVPFSFGREVIDSGEYAQLTCVVSRGDMPITITWSLKGQELNSGPSITTNMLGRRASILIISSVDYSHVGEYTCRATNMAGSVTYAAELNVNGNHLSVAGRSTGNLLLIKSCLMFQSFILEPPRIVPF